EADCTISTDVDTFMKLKSGDLNPMMAVMSGKIKISGDIGLAMKLQSLL
ncbi:MAG TPA: SCP2 sterol-binding domain-containing protein, partial [Saprospiraceae bacterium]|nr:SCP2 sterol-binding domain-containing protein [Saprospiraceae bacterium]